MLISAHFVICLFVSHIFLYGTSILFWILGKQEWKLEEIELRQKFKAFMEVSELHKNSYSIKLANYFIDGDGLDLHNARTFTYEEADDSKELTIIKKEYSFWKIQV